MSRTKKTQTNSKFLKTLTTESCGELYHVRIQIESDVGFIRVKTWYEDKETHHTDRGVTLSARGLSQFGAHHFVQYCEDVIDGTGNLQELMDEVISKQLDW
jgi:hypothetical protein